MDGCWTCTRYLSHPWHTEPNLGSLKKAILYITDFSLKMLIGYQCFTQALNSLWTFFDFFVFFQNWNHAISAETTYMNQKKEKYL